MATNGDDGKFYGPVHSVYIPFSKINGDYAFFLSFSFFLPLFFFFLFFIENKILTMDFSAFYDISNLESFHDKLRLSRLDLSSAISSKDRLIDSSIDRRICRLIVSLELILISPNLRFRPPSPFFYDRFRSFLVTRNDVSFTTSKNDFNPCFQRGHVRLFYRRALLPLAFDSTVSSSRGKHLETRRNAFSTNDNRSNRFAMPM